MAKKMNGFEGGKKDKREDKKEAAASKKTVKHTGKKDCPCPKCR